MNRDFIKRTGKKGAASLDERGATAAYIAEMLDEFAVIAKKNDMSLLVYFLQMCRLEAYSIAKDEGLTRSTKNFPSGSDSRR